ncbi:MerR family transcriptional regulator [Actinomadura coerulea]|uniref:MerR family transcriptional regulator n=1 Tax=Actinomadura coerulea TaxID=46159 RepID=UPI00161AB5F0|nr:MerR family transcriptional regulator [Actinomadura coerulea]
MPDLAGPVDAVVGGVEASDLGPEPLGVARRPGVAPSTLRTWDRRYGVGPTGGGPGGHRRYTQADVVRLETMQQMISAGAPPAASSWQSPRQHDSPRCPGRRGNRCRRGRRPATPGRCPRRRLRSHRRSVPPTRVRPARTGPATDGHGTVGGGGHDGSSAPACSRTM